MTNGPGPLCSTPRRLFLGHGLAACAAALLPPGLDGQPAMPARRRPARAIPAPAVPPARVSLADFGGRPGAGKDTLVEAFRRAFAALSSTGGGTLFVPAGTYDLGRFDDPEAVIVCRGLRDIAISAYGAVFRAETTARVMPHLFYFFNFDNVTLAGARFEDAGFIPWVDWQGMYCVGIQADRPSSGFTMVDCCAHRVLGLLASNNDARGRHFLSDIHVQGEVRYAYYGVGASHVREGVSVDLDCHNVRRAFIAYALRDADVAVRATSTAGWPGSNGLVALVCAGASDGNVENVRIAVDVSGASIHSSYVHFYHQGPQREGAMRGIDATVNALGMTPMRCLFLFDHETHGVQPSTARTWDRIALHGGVTGGAGREAILNTSVSTAPGVIRVDRRLARPVDVNRLGRGFRLAAS